MINVRPCALFCALALCSTTVYGKPQIDCVLRTTNGVDFGSYDPFVANDINSTGAVEVECSKNGGGKAPYSYELRLSAGSSGSYTGRQLVSGTSTLDYQLYTDSSRTVVWGDGSGSTATVTSTGSLAGGAIVNGHTIYATLIAGQNVAAGTYTDTITVTVMY